MALVAFAIATPRVELPGLYYDEAFMAQQAKDFFEPERESDHAASTRQVALFGRPFPLRNAVYLGSLKSQLMIPVFGLFGAERSVLRLASLGTGLLALLFSMLFARALLGNAVALLGGLLLVSDPSFLFFSLYEWGPFTTGLLCRCLALWALLTGWRDQRRYRLVVGGLALGLGVYNRADFVVIGVALAGALLFLHHQLLIEGWRRRRADASRVIGALILGAAPMLISVVGLLATSGSTQVARRGGLGEKLQVLWSLLDGSRFYRVIEFGGRFERMFEAAAPWTPFGLAVILAAVGSALAWRRLSPGHRFLLLAALGIVLGTLAVPGAVRAHHQLNTMPLPHLLVAAASVALVRAWSSRAGRFVLTAALALVVVGNALVVERTFGLIERSGGRGRFSDALDDVAREVESEAGARVVSLDWGFHEPLLFLTRETPMLQPIWRIGPMARQHGSWVHEGGAGDRYLVHEEEYDLFGFGPRFLLAAEALAEQRPEFVQRRRHLDREGAPVFTSLRFAGPHRVVYRRGAFLIEAFPL